MMPDDTTPSEPRQREARPADSPWLFRLRSHHSTRPDIPAEYFETAAFVSVFENRYGEQWVFTWRHNQPYGVLWGGDVDWFPEKVWGPETFRWGLTDDEKLWLITSWFAACMGHHPNETLRSVVAECGALTYLRTGEIESELPERDAARLERIRADDETQRLMRDYSRREIERRKRDHIRLRDRQIKDKSDSELKALRAQLEAEAEAIHGVKPEEWQEGGTETS
jgi:hypothetical protein